MWQSPERILCGRLVRCVGVCTRSVYGPTAWWWEVEELVRKLLLTSVVVLLDEGSPLQVQAPPPPSHPPPSPCISHPALAPTTPFPVPRLRRCTLASSHPPIPLTQRTRVPLSAPMSAPPSCHPVVPPLRLRVAQVAFAVLVSAWAHVLHAVYKPWTVSAAAAATKDAEGVALPVSRGVMYHLQHASLLVTTFVFLTGLMYVPCRPVGFRLCSYPLLPPPPLSPPYSFVSCMRKRTLPMPIRPRMRNRVLIPSSPPPFPAYTSDPSLFPSP